MSRLETKPAPAEEAGPGSSQSAPPSVVRDIRSAQPYLLSRTPITAFLRRVSSIAALVLIDLSGLAFGVYASLVLRDLYRGNNPPLWGVLWRQEIDWLPFITVVTVLVFWQAGLYAPRERRAG